jgi:hypothetical protein
VAKGPERLMTTFYPGDMDKIAFSPGDRGRIELANDATQAHKLLQWFRCFQELTEAGIGLGEEQALYEWQEQAEAVLKASKEFM